MTRIAHEAAPPNGGAALANVWSIYIFVPPCILPWRKRLHGRAPLGGKFVLKGSAGSIRCRNTTKPRKPAPAMARMARRPMKAGSKKEPKPPPPFVVGGFGFVGGNPVPPPFPVVCVGGIEVGVCVAFGFGVAVG